MKEKEIKDTELENVNGGVMPIIYDAESRIPIVRPLVEKTESEKAKEEKNDFVPIP